MTAEYETFNTLGGRFTERVLVSTGRRAPPDVLPDETIHLISTWWACPRCGYQQRGGPPAHCMFNAEPDDCPLV